MGLLSEISDVLCHFLRTAISAVEKPLKTEPEKREAYSSF